MSKQNNKKKYGYHHKAPARNSTVLLPHIYGKSYEESDPEVPVASSSRRPIAASATPPPRYAAHKRPAPLEKSGSESSVTLTDDSSPPTPPEPAPETPPFSGFKRPAIPSRFAANKRPAHSSSPSPKPPSTPPLPSCCRPSSSVKRSTSGSTQSPYRIPKYSPSNPGPIRFNPPLNEPIVLPRT
ncbi:hypothetical protein AYI69_g9426 [Smittium culicis]|uniref:Uncharacterized protein n=1 Tax=Smittium culicis TaxID=133412 RepID=A0A1R1XCP1_9FUNG|nr:hypothetical protein AYI69_g9426 [Smittium culicis]